MQSCGAYLQLISDSVCKPTILYKYFEPMTRLHNGDLVWISGCPEFPTLLTSNLV